MKQTVANLIIGDLTPAVPPTRSQIHCAIHDWVREDAPFAVKKSVMPKHVAALARRLSEAKRRGGDNAP